MTNNFHPDHLLKISTPEGIHICIYPVSLVKDIHTESKKISPRDQVRLRKITHEQKKREFLASRLAIRELDPHYRLTYEGRIPSLDNGRFISISHAHKVAAAVMSADKRVGIDIEAQREQLFRISDKFLHPDEKLAVRPWRVLEDLHVYWGAKEALFKIWRMGEVDFSHELRVDEFEPSAHGQTTARILKDNKVIHCKVQYHLVEGYHLVFAWEEDAPAV
jgi:4'-phosphopantetheinyl transferase EntD